jgi:hypothetical protein
LRSGLLGLFLAIVVATGCAAKSDLKFGPWTVTERSSGMVAGTWDWNAANETFTAHWLSGHTDYLHLDKWTDEDVQMNGFNELGDPVHFEGTKHDRHAEGTANVTLKNGGKITWSWGATW